MNAKAALIYHLLRGDVLTIGSAFKIIGISNLPREIGRSIERDKGNGCHGFGVVVSKIWKDGPNRYSTPTVWKEYRLNKTERNAPGIEKMKIYLREHAKGHPKEKEFIKVCQPNLF
jgi:hypothetical protein